MGFETKISVRTHDLGRLVNALARAGCVILDAGERIATDEGPAAEASIAVLFLDEPDHGTYHAAGVTA